MRAERPFLWCIIKCYRNCVAESTACCDCVTWQRSWWLTIRPQESIACPLVPKLSRVSWVWATWRVSHVTWCVLVTVSQLSVSLHFTSEGCIHTNQPGRTYHWQYLLSSLSRPIITRASLEVMCRNICSHLAQHRTVTMSPDTCWGKPWCQWLLRHVVTIIPSSTSQSFLSLSLASLLSPLVCSVITVNVSSLPSLMLE